MKLLVETTGSFMLKDPSTGDELDDAHPSVVRKSEFVQSRTAIGQINIINANLKEEATDAEFQKFWVESGRNRTLAIASFLSAWEKKEEEAPEEEAKPTPASKAKAKGKQ